MELGANLPWITYGGDFGSNAWRPAGGLASTGIPPEVVSRVGELSRLGVAMFRWFLFCDGRAGIRFSEDGEPQGLDECVLPDLDVALRFAADLGIQLVPTLFDFHWCGPRDITAGVNLRGHSATLTDPDRRHALIERVIAPVLEHAGDHPAVRAWDVINEPEWTSPPVRSKAMRAFVAEVAAIAHQLSGHPVTVGLASAAGLDLVRDLGLDFYQVHWYDKHERQLPLAKPVADFKLDKPIVLGEFPTRGSARSPGEILETAAQAGYVEAWFWSVASDDHASDFAASIRGLTKL